MHTMKKCSQCFIRWKLPLSLLWMMSVHICCSASASSKRSTSVSEVCIGKDYFKTMGAGKAVELCMAGLTDPGNIFKEVMPCCNFSSIMEASLENSSSSLRCHGVATIKSLVKDFRDDGSAQSYVSSRLSGGREKSVCSSFFGIFCAGRFKDSHDVMEICYHYSAWAVATLNVIRCPPPQIPGDSALWYRLSGALSQRATFGCDHSHEIGSDKTSHCNMTSLRWSQLPNCIPIKKEKKAAQLLCRLPRKENLTYQVSQNLKQLDNFACHPGSALRGNIRVATCNETTKKWSPLPKCRILPTEISTDSPVADQVLRCKLPHNGSLSYQLSDDLSELSQFVCVGRFKVIPPSVVAKCNHTSGNWMSLPECVPVSLTNEHPTSAARTDKLNMVQSPISKSKAPTLLPKSVGESESNTGVLESSTESPDLSPGASDPNAKPSVSSTGAPDPSSVVPDPGTHTSESSTKVSSTGPEETTTSNGTSSGSEDSENTGDGKISMTNTQGFMALLLLLVIAVLLYMAYTNREAIRDKILSQDSNKPVYQKLPTTVKDSLEAGLSRLKHNTHED